VEGRAAGAGAANEVIRMIAGGRYRRASVGACELPTTSPFARFRLAVLLYQ